MAADYNNDRNLLENIATTALETTSGVYDITGRDRNTECIVCKREWSQLSDDPLQLKWQGTRQCMHHYLCTECYYRIAYDDDGILRHTFKCPQCRAEEHPHSDKGRVHFAKFQLLELLNAGNERCIHIQQEILATDVVVELKKEIVELKDKLNLIEDADSLQSLATKNKELMEQVKCLTAMNDKSIASADASHGALTRAIYELNELKRRHAERIALMEKEIIILTDTITKNKREAEELRDQTNAFKDQLQFHALNVRVEHELNGLSFVAMKTDILDKLNRFQAKEEYIPAKLKEDMEKRLHHEFAQELIGLGKRHYDEAIANLASIDVTKYLLSKPCIRESLLLEVGRHLREHDECTDDCGMITTKVKEIIDGLDTISGLEQITNEQILSHRNEILEVTCDLPESANGLLQPITGTNLNSFLTTVIPEKYNKILKFAHQLGINQRCEKEDNVQSTSSQPPHAATATAAPLPPPLPRNHISHFVPILPKAGMKRKATTTTKDIGTDPMPGGKKQRRVKSTQTSDSLKQKPEDELFLFGGSILNLSLKREEFENKVEAALKLWKEQKEERDAIFHGFYCYDWNTKLLPNENMKNITCVRNKQKNIMTDHGTTSTEIISEPCTLNHRCMYIMASGNICLSTNHNYMQHAVFFDMPVSEALKLHGCGIITTKQRDLVESMIEERYMKLSKTKYGKVCDWIARFGLLDECELPVIEGTDIINTNLFKM